MSDQENKQAKQDLPADPAPKPSPEKRPEKQAPPPAKITAPASKKVKNPKRVAAGKFLAARNKEKLIKIKAFEEAEKQTESVKQDQRSDRTEAVIESKPADPDWSLLFLVGGGVAFVGLSAAFGYQKWTANAPAPTTLAKPPAEPVKLPSPASNLAEKKSDPFEEF